jgi:hypothetical protein
MDPNKLKNLKSLSNKGKKDSETKKTEEVAKTETPSETKPEVKSEAKSDTAATVKKAKKGFDEAKLEEYVKILSDGNAHSIHGLLDHFKLDHTSSGREVLRTANRTINQTGKFKIETMFVDSKKANKLVKL